MLPSLETLQMLSLIYKVQLSWFIEEHPDDESSELTKRRTNLYIAISSAIVLAVWVFALIIFLVIAEQTGKYYLITFMWTIPATAFCLRFALKRFFKNKLYLPTASLCLWLTIICIYVQWYRHDFWPVFLFGVPIQLILILNDAIKKIKTENAPIKTKTKKQ